MRILNLGAGVGPTTVYLLAMDGLIDPIDHAIFADTMGEPAAVYSHLRWLQSLGGPPIIVRSRGDLAANLSRGVNAAGQGRKGGSGRFVSIPAYTSAPLDTSAAEGQVPRQCTREYKVDVVEQAIRELFGLKSRQRMPKGTEVVQLFGLHDDEVPRIRRVRARFASHPWASAGFPLAEVSWDRARCVAYLAKRVPHEVPRSACTFCPYRSDSEWKHLRDTDPAGWAQAVAVDGVIRDPASARARGMEAALYLHRSCVPLAEADIDAGAAREAARLEAGRRQLDLFSVDDCVGMCGM